MIVGLLLALGVAFGGVADDLTIAANSNTSEAVRMEAFNRLVSNFNANEPTLNQVLFDQDANARERWIAARVYGRSNSAGALSTLASLTSDPQPAMRAAAASALGDLGARDGARAVEALLTDPAIFVRVEAADALAKIASPNSAGPLERALMDDSNFYRGKPLWVRQHYVTAIATIGDRSSVNVLMQVLEDEDPLVAQGALQALTQITGKDFSEGRSQSEQIAAWRRWHGAQ